MIRVQSATDGQRHLSSGALNLVGKLHAGGRRADDENPTAYSLAAANAGLLSPIRQKTPHTSGISDRIDDLSRGQRA